MSRPDLDPQKLEQFTQLVAGAAHQGMNCALSFVGDHLGLYETLHRIAPADSVELADAAGLSERWVREWLYQQACAGQIEYDEASDEFSLSPEAVAVLVDEDHPAYLAGMFHSVVALYEGVDRLPESFRTGIGRSYESRGEACACGVHRMSRQFQRHQLVGNLLPKLDGVVEKLDAGIRVADVGCGSATSTVAMAAAFPKSQFVGYDNSRAAIQHATRAVRGAGVDNVQIVDPTHDPLPEDGSFELITTFDVIHDSTHPAQLIAAIRKSLPEDGTWLCADIKGKPTFAENLRDNPIAPIGYAFSILICMSAALSLPDGAGLGTLGFHEQKAREMTAEQGFGRFRRIDYEGDIFNAYYEIRP
ncbi:MAG: class I SAM-dependent methyltransferase [Thermoanaerobaculia bacterium]|nr:class I SAM-dependent methyltransferase [Thermoanaerobaculia bacterium]